MRLDLDKLEAAVLRGVAGAGKEGRATIPRREAVSGGQWQLE